MVSLSAIDRTKPIGYQRTCSLSDQALLLFPDLKLIDQEPQWCSCSPDELTDLAERNEYALKKFRRKLDCCAIVDGLLRSDPDPVVDGIKKLSVHVTGGPLEKYFFRHAHKIRSNAELQKRIEPVTNALIETACLELKEYVHNGLPEVLDDNYRNFRVFSSAVVRLSPTVAPALHQEFGRILASRRTEFAPDLYLASFRAMGYVSEQITEWDEQYLRLWRCDPGSPEGWSRGVEIAAYNIPSSVGWNLMKMRPSRVDRFLRRHRDSILRSLVSEIGHKCARDPAANAARLAARFLTLHLALHVLNGNQAYSRLPIDLAAKVLRISETVRRAMRRNDDGFGGKLQVEKMTGAVSAFLRREITCGRSMSLTQTA